MKYYNRISTVEVIGPWTITYLAMVIGEMLSTNDTMEVGLHQLLDNCYSVPVSTMAVRGLRNVQ